MIYPNVFSDIKKLNRISIKWYANNPFLCLKTSFFRIIKKVKSRLYGR